MDAKISRTVKEWRAKRSVYGSSVSQNYMDSLNKGSSGSGEGEEGGKSE